MPPELSDYYDHASNTFNYIQYFEDDEEYIKESTAKRIRQYMWTRNQYIPGIEVLEKTTVLVTGGKTTL